MKNSVTDDDDEWWRWWWWRVCFCIYAGTKESAFIYAISSAGIAHSVTSGCSSGQLPGCSCGSSRHGPSQRDFRWEGCSDDIDHGVEIARSFTDIKERSGNKKERRGRALALILHNNSAGRKVSSLYSIHWQRNFSLLMVLAYICCLKLVYPRCSVLWRM